MTDVYICVWTIAHKNVPEEEERVITPHKTIIIKHYTGQKIRNVLYLEHPPGKATYPHSTVMVISAPCMYMHVHCSDGRGYTGILSASEYLSREK